MPTRRRQQYCYDYPRPAVTVDVVIFTLRESALQVLLIRRGKEPFQGRWAIPGGFVEMDESLEAGAARELAEETGVKNVYLKQLAAFGDPGRDPRGRTITVTYFAVVQASKLAPRAADDAAETGWFAVDSLPPLAFDHDRILTCALERLRAELPSTPLAAHLLPRTFSIEQLQRVHEAVLGELVPHARLLSQMLARGLIREVNAGGARAVAKFRFTPQRA